LWEYSGTTAFFEAHFLIHKGGNGNRDPTPLYSLRPWSRAWGCDWEEGSGHTSACSNGPHFRYTLYSRSFHSVKSIHHLFACVLVLESNQLESPIQPTLMCGHLGWLWADEMLVLLVGSSK
jgi:hypothetical protein